jgi:2'-5' RNA ligase
MESVRSFIALELSDETKKELSALIQQLKTAGADVKWSNPNNIHLTLKFLGHITHDRIDVVKKAIDTVAHATAVFQFTLAGTGAFPKPSYPRVIWVGIREGKQTICNLAEAIETYLEKNGFTREDRPFSPHLTVGRVKSSKNRQNLVAQLEGNAFASKHAVEVNHITLFQSTLRPQGPIYTPLHAARLSH